MRDYISPILSRHTRTHVIALSLVVAVSFASASIPAVALTQDALYYYKQGFAAEKAGRGTQAYASYKKALELDPTDGTLYLVMGQMLERSQQANEAASVYQAGLAHNPNDILLNAAMARLLEAGGQASKAGQYNKVLAESRFDFPYVFFVNADSPQPVTVSSLSGQTFTLNQTPGYTRSGYNTFMERPQVAKLYEYLGNQYGRMGRLQDAYNAYQMAVKVDPQGNPQVYPKMAAIMQAEGDTAGVVRAQNNYRAYQELAAREAASVPAVAALPQITKSVSAKVIDSPTVFLSSSRVDSSAQSKPQILSSAPNTAFLVSQTPEKSAAEIAAQRGNTDTVFLSSIGTAGTIVPSEFLPYIKLQRYDEFQYGWLKQLVLAHPENTEARLTMASMDLDRSRVDEAMVNLDELLRRDPSNVMGLWMRAKALVARGRYDDGLADMDTAYRLQPNNMLLLEDLAQTLRRKGYWQRSDALITAAGLTPAYQGTSPIAERLGVVPSATASVSARVVETPDAPVAYPLLVPSDLARQSQALNAASQTRMQSKPGYYNNTLTSPLALPSGVQTPAIYGPQPKVQVLPGNRYGKTYYVMP